MKLPTILLLLLALIGAAPVTAAPIPYVINFTASIGEAPSAGSFSYDSATATFSGFNVVWRGISFDLTSAANNPSVSGTCNGSGGPGADAFLFLSDPTCGDGIARTYTYDAISNEFADQFNFRPFDTTANLAAFGQTRTPGSFPGPGGAAGFGNFTIAVAAVPEPSAAGMLWLATGSAALLAMRRRRQGA